MSLSCSFVYSNPTSNPITPVYKVSAQSTLCTRHRRSLNSSWTRGHITTKFNYKDVEPNDKNWNLNIEDQAFLLVPEEFPFFGITSVNNLGIYLTYKAMISLKQIWIHFCPKRVIFLAFTVLKTIQLMKYILFLCMSRQTQNFYHAPYSRHECKIFQ